MELKIRKAKPNDWKLLQDLNHNIFHVNTDYEDYFNTEWEFTKYGIDYFREISSGKDYFTIIAYDGGKPIGYLNGHEREFEYRKDEGRRVGEIENVGVLPEYQRKGVGLKMVDEFKAWCKEKSLTILLVNSYVKNKAAVGLYEKLGLKPFDMNFEGEI